MNKPTALSRYLIECIPNVSTADPQVLDALARAISSVPEVTLKHTDPGKSANRTVFTYLGPAEAVFEATAALFDHAADLIDMRTHTGVHPRMGAVDVCPFVLLDDPKYKEDLLGRTAAFGRAQGALGRAIYYYEQSALSADRANLARVRNGQYEGLAERWALGEYPDAGPTEWSTAAQQWGATALGVRPLMVAYNINLSGGTIDERLRAAKDIAREVRESSGGLPGVKAIGWYLPDLDVVQVSCNLTRPDEAGVCRVFSAVRAAAKRRGFSAPHSELIGCIPQSQLQHCTAKSLGLGTLKPFDERRILPF